MHNKRYKKQKKYSSALGKVDHVNMRYAYIVVSEERQDIYVRTRNLLSAIHGDTVEVAVFPSKKRHGPEGKVVKIIKRHRSRFVGYVEETDNTLFVIPDFKKLHQQFVLLKGKNNTSQANDKVIFEVTHWGGKRHYATASVVEVLGKRGEHETEMHAIMAEFELPDRFSEKALQETTTLLTDIPHKEVKRRRDFRKTLTLTIDPEDAQDFDDALSINTLNPGRHEIGIHIADVSYYVKPGTALDSDAYSRGTSAYLVDRTVPMLPERLSNELCSLRPKEEKLCFSIVFEMDDSSNIHKTWIGETIIHSDYRLSYEQAQKAMEADDHSCTQALNTLNKIALQLRKKRIERGAIDFETTEMKFVLDAQKKPLSLQPKERKEAHKLIEEFMLLANKAIASHIRKQSQKEAKNAFIYRVHDPPDPEKVADFASFARQFGHRIDTTENAITGSINALLKKAEGKPEQNILQQLAIRTMAKATYTTQAKSHFGLAFAHYTHFTSPIRRYPDVMVHRMLKSFLNGNTLQQHADRENQCIHCTEKEKKAVNAERASVKYKQVELMSTAQDKLYQGIITGIADFGIFVELTETRCEGVVKIKSMKDDLYEADLKKFRVVGRRSKKTYRLGDIVTSRIKKVDIHQRTINLTLEQTQ